jgi:D-galactarolactone cycloisomerase
MKITAVKSFLMQYRVARAFGPSTAMYPHRTTLLVKIETDEGLVGWGETAPIGAVQAMIERHLGPTLIGKDPLTHRKLWRGMWGPNFGDALAVAGLDLALHDLWGKALGLPIHALYGGALRERVPAYASAMNYQEGLEPEQHYPEEAAHFAGLGYRALKMRLGGQPLGRDVAAATAVRQVVGPDVLLMADGNGAYSHATAVKMGRALEELDFYWFEEPLPQPNHAGYETLASTLDIAIAGGEGLGSREEFKNLVTRHAVDIVQPDVSLCGGFRECLFVAEMARLWAIPCMPHCWGGAIVVAATVHLLALLPDASWARATETPMLEMDTAENPFRDQLAGDQLHIGKDGMVAVPTGPGLGIEVDEEMVKHYTIG